MADVLYGGLQDDDKLVAFGIDAGGAKLVPKAETPAGRGPSACAVSPDRRVWYVGYRGTPGIEICRMDPASGALTSLGRVATERPPTYLAADRAGSARDPHGTVEPLHLRTAHRAAAGRTSPARISSRSSDSTRPPGGSIRTASSFPFAGGHAVSAGVHRSGSLNR